MAADWYPNLLNISAKIVLQKIKIYVGLYKSRNRCSFISRNNEKMEEKRPFKIIQQ